MSNNHSTEFPSARAERILRRRRDEAECARVGIPIWPAGAKFFMAGASYDIAECPDCDTWSVYKGRCGVCNP